MSVKGQNLGFDKEKFFKNSINNRYVSDLEKKYKKIVNSLFNNLSENTFLKAERDKDFIKPDLRVDAFDGNIKKKVYLSLKSGLEGHSIHQEPAKDFVKFLNNNGLNEEEIKNFLFFHWADGTFDDSGALKNRMSLRRFKKIHHDKYKNLCKSLKKISVPILYRVFYRDLPIDESYYLVFIRDENVFHWSFKNVINFHKNFNNPEKVCGNLSLQNWNPCLSGQEKKGKKHRKDIQFKWGNILKDMNGSL